MIFHPHLAPVPISLELRRTLERNQSFSLFEYNANTWTFCSQPPMPHHSSWPLTVVFRKSQKVRKLWSKMADKEWRVSAKALYIVHRFAADGSIEHATNLKESVAVLRTHHDSRRKVRRS